MHILFSTGYDPSRDTIFGYYFIFLSRIEFLFTCQSMILQITSIFHHYELGLISGYFVFLGNIIMTFVWLVHRRIILIIYFNFTPIRVYFSFYLHCVHSNYLDKISPGKITFFHLKRKGWISNFQRNFYRIGIEPILRLPLIGIYKKIHPFCKIFLRAPVTWSSLLCFSLFFFFFKIK